MRVLSPNQIPCTDNRSNLTWAAPQDPPRLTLPLPVRRVTPAMRMSPVPAGDASPEESFLGPSSGISLPTPSHSRSPTVEPILVDSPTPRDRGPHPMTTSDQDYWHRLATTSLTYQLRDAPDTLLRNRIGKEFPDGAPTVTWAAGVRTALPAAPDVRFFFFSRTSFT